MHGTINIKVHNNTLHGCCEFCENLCTGRHTSRSNTNKFKSVLSTFIVRLRRNLLKALCKIVLFRICQSADTRPRNSHPCLMDINEITFSHVLCNSVTSGSKEQLPKSEQFVTERSTCSLAVNSYKMLITVKCVSNINCVCLQHSRSKQCLLVSTCLRVSRSVCPSAHNNPTAIKHIS